MAEMLSGIGEICRQRGAGTGKQGFKFLVAGLERSLAQGKGKDVNVKRSVEVSVRLDLDLQDGELGRMRPSRIRQEDGKQEGQPGKGWHPAKILTPH